jgi:hypothetical protein
MVAYSPCIDTTPDQVVVLDSAVAVWAVLEVAADTPSTPERKERLTRAREALARRLAAAGLEEADLIEHLERIRAAASPRVERRSEADGEGHVVPFAARITRRPGSRAGGQAPRFGRRH